jgi:preprotein translocase subunit SecG
MQTFLTALHIVVCVFLILVVLLQAGKGGGMGIAFGGAGSQTVFGSSGAGNFLTRLTSITAALFMITSLGLAHYSSQQDSKRLQKLAEQKAGEKKAEDERAAKLKAELEKATQSAKPAAPGTPAVTGTGGAAMVPPPAPAVTPEAPAKPAKGAAKPAAKPETTDGETAPPPKRKKRAAAPKDESGATPAAAPAAAPPPAQ